MKHVKILISVGLLFFFCSAGYSQISIGGPSELCFDPMTQYTFTATGGSGHGWTLPSNMVLVSGGAGQNFVTVRLIAAGTGKNVQVTSSAGSATLTTNSYVPITATGSLTGPSEIVTGQTGVNYTLAGTSQWPTTWVAIGSTITSGQGTGSIAVSFPPSYTSGVIILTPTAGPCQSHPLMKTVTVYPTPGTPGEIAGATLVTPGQSGLSYRIPPVAFATTYDWVLPAGATISSGAGTESIMVSFSTSFTGGLVKVRGMNGSMSGEFSSSLAVSAVGFPDLAGSITGNTMPCVNPSGATITYSTPTIPGATSYSWTIEGGATPIGSTTSNTISINFPSNIADNTVTLSVKGVNANGAGLPSSTVITIDKATAVPGAAGTISGSTQPCQGGALFTYSIPVIANALEYLWTVPSGATIVSGANTNSIEVSYSLSASPGNITVRGTNCKGSGTQSSKAITYATTGIGTVATDRVAPTVDLATGIMSSSIPLFSVSDGDLSVPGVISYSATGVRIADDDGWVGHNWGLSVQGYQIAREVRGLPDDYSVSGDTRKGWLNSTTAATVKNFIPTTDNNSATCSDEVANYNTLNTFNYNTDLEPDVFYVNAPGVSFQFYFDENKIPRALPYQDVIITPNTVTGAISSFTVKDSRGILYTFSEKETVTQSLQTPSNYYSVRNTHLYQAAITYTTAWRLVSMTSPVYGTISFTYKTVNLSDSKLIPKAHRNAFWYTYNYTVDYDNENGTQLEQFSYQRLASVKILQKVSSPVMEAVFTSSQKSVTTLLERLQSISIYDKREGTPKLVRTISLSYNLSGNQERAYLVGVSASAGCLTAHYSLEYYPGELPNYDSWSWTKTDDWGFYHNKYNAPYSESVHNGSLKKITYPYGGYDIFFYEPHQYWNGSVIEQGAGLRLKKMITYDGVSSDGDRVLEYGYNRTDGQSSGKLQYRAQHNFSVTRLKSLYIAGLGMQNNLRYQEYQATHTVSETNRVFNVKSSVELSLFGPFRGSAVAYERVIVKDRDAGQTIVEFELPASFGEASANNNEWQASKVSIARPSTGASGCYALANIQEGIAQYPYPPDPNYDFARALLKKVTNVREDGVAEREVTYSYQRIYGNGSSIRKIYGLALEELPTYYHNGSTYQDAKMFVYSKYEIFTDVKIELSTQTETVYNSNDLVKKTVTTTNYHFDSPNHKELSRVETVNSDGTTSRKKLRYSKDYVVTTPSGTAATALASLKTANRMAIVETITSHITDGTEKTIGGSLALYQTIGTKVYPYQQYAFTSTEGTTTFVPSSISGGSTFQFDQSTYVLNNTIVNVDSYGNVTETIGRNKISQSVGYGYGGTLPIIQVSNAGVNEIKYSDFETSSPVNLSVAWGSAVYVTGRNNSKGLLMPNGSEGTNMLVSQLSHNYVLPRDYTLSLWIKAPTAGNLTLKVVGSGISGSTFTLPFTSSTDYKYYQLKVPVASLGSTGASLVFLVWSSAAINIDDVAVYPDQSDFITSTYLIPNGKNSETDSRGVSNYYEHDLWGRPRAVYDQDKNVIRKIDYQVKP